ncbi:hypothetical protein Lgor_2241 [Fluoribacter gormanii]|uniref:Uncharacterized protein n=1 Tax=Fluoribacter gormanii TaxID=464 RepID=A0A377GL75_9GAMM|nr:hypothetical protein Lgor_2241 [Fluoribacter gormanii]SIR23575.1 hypothetical protein SAMN05421777_108111 [Fluoribacter gormanii]STO25364.1 Uncharacterised protein [Fluoribacter gormanii]
MYILAKYQTAISPKIGNFIFKPYFSWHLSNNFCNSPRHPEPDRSEGEGAPAVYLGYSHVKKHLKNYVVVIK